MDVAAESPLLAAASSRSSWRSKSRVQSISMVNHGIKAIFIASDMSTGEHYSEHGFAPLCKESGERLWMAFPGVCQMGYPRKLGTLRHTSPLRFWRPFRDGATLSLGTSVHFQL